LEWLVVKAVSHAAVTPLDHPVDSVMSREIRKQGELVQVDSIRLQYINSDTKAVFSSAQFVYRYNIGSVNPDEFSVAHYQITPPVLDVYEDRRFNWPVWTGVGVLCLAASALLAWVVRRARRE
jgi:hypothetical protein